MESLFKSLAADFLKRIEKELGREVTLRLLWPHVVGPRLAGNTQLKGVRGTMLIVSVPDRSWLSSLESLDKMILNAANRLGGERRYDSIEFLEEPRMLPPREASRSGTGNRAHELAAREQRTGNRALMLEECRSTPVEFDTGMIADENLRGLFLESARKYFSIPPGAAPGGNPAFTTPSGGAPDGDPGFPAQEDRRS